MNCNPCNFKQKSISRNTIHLNPFISFRETVFEFGLNTTRIEIGFATLTDKYSITRSKLLAYITFHFVLYSKIYQKCQYDVRTRCPY